jgi:clan AA aspartic protease
MGKVMTELKLINLVDLRKSEQGLLPPEQVRRLQVEALVDTGATTLVLPADVVAALGLTEINRRKCRLADGSVGEIPTVSDLMIVILGREMSCDALVMPVGSTPLIGQIPLEALDLVVDPKSRDPSVNPASPDMPTLDALLAS